MHVETPQQTLAMKPETGIATTKNVLRKPNIVQRERDPGCERKHESGSEFKLKPESNTVPSQR